MKYTEFMNQPMHMDIRRMPAGYNVHSGVKPRREVLAQLSHYESYGFNPTGTIYHTDGSITVNLTKDGRNNNVNYSGKIIPVK